MQEHSLRRTACGTMCRDKRTADGQPSHIRDWYGMENGSAEGRSTRLTRVCVGTPMQTGRYDRGIAADGCEDRRTDGWNGTRRNDGRAEETISVVVGAGRYTVMHGRWVPVQRERERPLNRDHRADDAAQHRHRTDYPAPSVDEDCFHRCIRADRSQHRAHNPTKLNWCPRMVNRYFRESTSCMRATKAFSSLNARYSVTVPHALQTRWW